MQVPLGDTYYFKFTTRAFATGVPTTLSGTPVLSVYEENNLTQITAGVSVTADYDSVTGLNEAAIVATSGNGYEVGKYYDVVITTGTVGGTSVVGETIGHFRVMAAEGVAGVPDVNTTHVSDTAQTANDNGADINTLLTRIVGTLAAGTHNPASAAQIAVLSDWIDGGRLDLLLDAIKAVTDAQAATGTGLTAIPWNAAWDAEVQSEVNDGLVAFFTSAAALVDLIWDEPIAGHLTAGTEGLYLAVAGGIILDTTATGTPTATEIQFTGGSTVANFYKDQEISIISGTGVSQSKPILSSSYSGGTTTLTFDEDFVVPAVSGDRLVIKFDHIHPITQIATQVMTSLDANGSTVIDELTTQGDTNETKLDTLTTTVGTAGAGLTDLGGMSTAMKAEVNAEVVDTLATDTYAEPGQGAPAATNSLAAKLNYLFKWTRNKKDNDGSTTNFYDDAGTTVDHKQTTSSAAGTVTKDEIVSGP